MTAIDPFSISVSAATNARGNSLQTGKGGFWGSAAHVGTTFSDNAWDTVELAGNKLPGVCEVKGRAEIECDKKKAKGRNGATLTFHGYQAAQFEITCTVWTAAQDTELARLVEILWIQPRLNPQAARQTHLGQRPATAAELKKPLAYDVSHPALARLGISACILVGVSIAETGSFDGSKVTRFKCIEYVIPTLTLATATVKGSRLVVAPDLRRNGKTKTDAPARPSTSRSDLGPKGPRPSPAGGSD